MSLRKSSRRRKGSKSEVLPNPNARRRCTPAPSSVGLDLISRLTGLMDILLLDYGRAPGTHGSLHELTRRPRAELRPGAGFPVWIISTGAFSRIQPRFLL